MGVPRRRLARGEVRACRKTATALAVVFKVAHNVNLFASRRDEHKRSAADHRPMIGFDQQSVGHFLRQRQLNTQIVELLAEVKKKHDLKQGSVTVAKNATYAKLTESLDEAISQGWLTPDELVPILNESEISGRQHVSIYQVTGAKLQGLADALSAPKHIRKSAEKLEEFWEIPDRSFARVLLSDKNCLMVKLVGYRKYHTIVSAGHKDDYELLKKYQHIERSAVIVKLDRSAKLLQFRVPPREHGGAETARAVYEFGSKMLSAHFDLSIIEQAITPLPIVNAFPALIENRDDFVLEYDTPEDLETKSSISRRLAGKKKDLRDTKSWQHESGYTRRTLRGSWNKGKSTTFVHMVHDTIQLDNKTKKVVARVFVPDRCTDEDMEHVISRIRDHIK